MHAETVRGRALSYVLATPEGFEPAAGFPLVVLLHGFGANMYDLAGLAPSIDPSGYVYAFPNAPYSLDFGGGATGYSWSLGRPGMPEPPPAGGPSVEELLDGFFAELLERTGAQRGRVVLGGFSQGGGLALRYGLPRPESFAGLAVLSGFFRDFDAVRARLPAAREQAIFLAHGRYDPLVGLALALEMKAFLEGLGYHPAYHEYDMAHEVSRQELADLSSWLHDVLPPKGPPTPA